MKTRILLFAFAFAAAVLVGCGSGGTDVTTDGVKSKERQAEEATKKLNEGKPDQGQGSQ